MTDIARDLIGTIRRTVSRRPQGAATAAPRELHVVVGLPAAVASEHAAGVEQRVDEVFADCVTRLGLHRSPEVEVARADGVDTVSVSAGGRPVAHFEPSADDVLPDAVANTVHRTLLRRLAVLLDDDDVAALGRPLDGAQSSRQTLEYLLDHGYALAEVERVEVSAQLDGASAAELAEHLIDAFARRPIVVQVSEQVLRRTPEDDRTRLVDVRTSLFERTGAQLPDVHLEVVEGADRATVRFNDVLLPTIGLAPDAGWNDVVGQLEPELGRYAPWFVDLDDLRRSAEELQYFTPELADLAWETFSGAAVCGCLRALLAQGTPIRFLPRILWLLLEAGPRAAGPDLVSLSDLRSSKESRSLDSSDPELLASIVRERIAFDAWVGGEAIDLGGAITLPMERETALVEAAAASDAASLALAEWSLVRDVHPLGSTATLVVHSPAAIRPVRRALRALVDPPMVIMSQELPPVFGLPPELRSS